jgi:hypothetical protein
MATLCQEAWPESIGICGGLAPAIKERPRSIGNGCTATEGGPLISFPFPTPALVREAAL